jgi:hypothetical protein
MEGIVMKISNLVALTFVFFMTACSSTQAHVDITQCESPQKFNIIERRFPSGDVKLFQVQDQSNLRLMTPDGRLVSPSQGQWGLMTPDGQLMHPPEWRYLDVFFEGRARFKDRNGKFGFLDEKGNILVPPQFDDAFRFNEGLAVVKSQGKWGYIDRSGKIAIPPTFRLASPFYEGRAFVISTQAHTLNQRDLTDLGGFIDKTGKLVTEEKFKVLSEFTEGKALVNYGKGKAEKSGILDLSGNLTELTNIAVDPFKRFRYGLAPAVDISPPNLPERIIDSIFDPFDESPTEYKYGFINQEGQFKIKPHFSNVGEFNYCAAAVKQNGRWGLIDTEGKIVIKPQFEYEPTYLGFGLVRILAEKKVVKENATVKIDGVPRSQENTRYERRYGIVNFQGNWIGSPDKSFIGDFNEGMLHFKQNGKSGFMDTTGKVVIEPKFDSAMPFVNDRSYVTIDNEQGYIDRTGKFIWRSGLSSKP